MDYEKKYNEALKRAKAAIDVAADKDLVKGVATTIFPELRESEDERIRQGLIRLMTVAGEAYLVESTGIKKESYLAYLEKQKDRMTAEEFESSELFQLKLKTKYANGYQDGLAQKEQKPEEPSDEELVRHPPIAYTYPSDASRDEQLKMALLALLNSDLIKVAGNKFTKQDLIDWVGKQKEHQDKTDAPKEKSVDGDFLSSHKDKNLDEIAQDYVDGVKEYNPEPTWDLMQTAVCYGYHFAEQKPISSCDIVPYIDDRIAELQDMWREEKVAFDWDDMHEMIEDVARHFYRKEQKPVMIQWTGKNLKEVIDFTGKCPKFGEWFKSWEEFENYVHGHDDILKLFCEDGSHYEVPVGAWIVKTPDGYNIPSRFRFIQKPVEWSEEDEDIRQSIIKDIKWERDNTPVTVYKDIRRYDEQINWLKSLRPQPKIELSKDVKKTLDEVSHILVGLNYKQIAKDYKQAIEKLLYSRPSWKPSEEDLMMLEHIIEQYETGNKNSKVRGYLPRVEELDFLKKVFEIWKN